MYSRLSVIKDWAGMAQQANWCATALAKNCGVSLRTLERYFGEQMGRVPHIWLEEERQKRARDILLNGSSVKKTALDLGYKNQQHFARAFKEHNGHRPSQHVLLGSKHSVKPHMNADALG